MLWVAGLRRRSSVLGFRVSGLSGIFDQPSYQNGGQEEVTEQCTREGDADQHTHSQGGGVNGKEHYQKTEKEDDAAERHGFAGLD